MLAELFNGSAELIAVILALAYVILAIRQSLWCWPAAAISASIYVMLFLEGRLFMESFLQLVYVLMAGYGFWQWKFGNRSGTSELKISTRSLRWHLLAFLFILVATLIVTFVLTRYTSQDAALLDSFTTIASLVTTYMVAKKVLENWLYWIVIDAFYVYLFAIKGFYLTAGLFLLYLGMAGYGYLKWRSDMRLLELQAAESQG
ncbi:MAG: nicotinamide mononucleotide transporter [Idiomarina sp.]|nr:nicotinamide mononucleotide transporter [Idiomarina sp.]